MSIDVVQIEQHRTLLTGYCYRIARPGGGCGCGLVDEEAMIEALRSGHIRHAGLDVFALEPLPAGHVLTTLENVTLSAHSAFRNSQPRI
jgi:D-isomer specific 2-hydroxyacid dehydrogenase-like protein